jgi:arabinoxylan arabinofuranohydrolase
MFSASIAFLTTLFTSCEMGGNKTAGNGADSRPKFAPGDTFIYNGNPIVDFRNSSDPTGRFFKYNDSVELYMFTSSDMDNLTNYDYSTYPMNASYCYSTSDMETWTDWGPILQESDFSSTTWAKVGANHLWAPDCISAKIDDIVWFYLYAPLLDKNVTCPTNNGGSNPISRIGTAKSQSPRSGFEIDPDYFKGIGSKNNGYVSDPGMFNVDGTVDGWYLTYTDGDWTTLDSGRICIAHLKCMTEADIDYGRVTINGAPNVYQEGSFLFKNDDYNSVYLMWSQKIDTNQQQQLAYAMASVDSFKANPKGCWQYKGLLIDAFCDEWTDHGSVVGRDGRWYLLYHGGSVKALDSTKFLPRNRKAGIVELKFNSDGTIQQVTDRTGPPKYQFAKLYALDEAYSQTNMVKPRLYIENNCDEPWSDFKIRYYFTVENGKTPVVEDYYTPNAGISLRYVNGNVWAVVLDFTGYTLAAGGRLPANDGISFGIHYSDWSYFNKANDYSQPQGASYTRSLGISVFSGTGEMVFGKTPQNIPPSSRFKNQYSGKLMTVTSSSDLASVACQDLNTSWTSQDWTTECVSGNTIRLKNIWSGKYLTVTSLNDCASVVCQNRDTSWTSQDWTVEPVSNGSKRLRNVWSGKYLTVTGTSEGASILAQNLNTGWTSQQWWIE